MTLNERNQEGYVLLALVLVLFVSGSSFLIGNLNARQGLPLTQQQDVQRQLLNAKAALLAFATHTPTLYAGQLGPGYLPCPDSDGDGWPQAAAGDPEDVAALCPAGLTLGRLPQRISTQTGDYRFGDYNTDKDRQLWYAVAPQHLRTSLNTAAATRTNATTARLTLDSSGGIAALLIAPGEPLGGQDRNADPDLYSHYLDGGNGASPTDFISQDPSDPDLFNDTVIAITHLELMQAIGTAVATAMKPELDLFHDNPGNNQYPAPHGWDAACIPVVVRNAMNESWMGSEGWNAASGCNITMFGFSWSFPNHRRHSFTSYARVDANRVRIAFAGCPGLAFVLTHDGSAQPEGSAC